PLLVSLSAFVAPAATQIYTLSLHDALPILSQLHRSPGIDFVSEVEAGEKRVYSCRVIPERGSWIELNTTKKDSITVRIDQSGKLDRKSTRLNSSHVKISYAVFCLKKKKKKR